MAEDIHARKIVEELDELVRTRDERRRLTNWFEKLGEEMIQVGTVMKESPDEMRLYGAGEGVVTKIRGNSIGLISGDLGNLVPNTKKLIDLGKRERELTKSLRQKGYGELFEQE